MGGVLVVAALAVTWLPGGPAHAPTPSGDPVTADDASIGARGEGDAPDINAPMIADASTSRRAPRQPAPSVGSDATASVDSKTERLIQEAMKRLCEGRTTFIIAQRLSTLQHADCIIVLQEGRVVASGKHEQLARESELYRSLFNQNSGMEIR